MYSFCAALRDLLLQVEPLSDGTSRLESPQQLERWALMQKTPGPGNGLGTAGGDWFTSAVNLREVETARKNAKLKNGQTLLQALAEGNKFGEYELQVWCSLQATRNRSSCRRRAFSVQVKRSLRWLSRSFAVQA